MMFSVKHECKRCATFNIADAPSRASEVQEPFQCFSESCAPDALVDVLPAVQDGHKRV